MHTFSEYVWNSIGCDKLLNSAPSTVADIIGPVTSFLVFPCCHGFCRLLDLKRLSSLKTIKLTFVSARR